jgi:hypothetical protein
VRIVQLDLQRVSPHTYRAFYSTVSRKNFSSVKTFIEEPDSREQCLALEENVKEFGLTYFGLSDRRQGTRRRAADLRLWTRQINE